MKKLKLLFVCLLLVFGFSCEYANDSGDDQISNDRTILGTAQPSSSNAFQILSAETKTFSYPVSLKNAKYLLSFNARIVYPILAGVRNILKVKVNGHVVSRYDLVNKAFVRNYPEGSTKYKFLYQDGRIIDWYSDSLSAWSLFYAPNMYSNNLNTSSGYRVRGGEATDYEFDITKYIINGNNQIQLIHDNVANDNIEIAGLQIWHEIYYNSGQYLYTGNTQNYAFAIGNPSKEHIIRFFGRIDNTTRAGGTNCIKAGLDGDYTFTKEDVSNKPTISDNYPSDSNRYKFTYNDGRSFLIERNQMFILLYSPDFWGNNCTQYEYGVIGGEAYQFDLQIPDIKQVSGSHTFSLTDTLLSSNKAVHVKDISVYELDNIN